MIEVEGEGGDSLCITDWLTIDCSAGRPDQNPSYRVVPMLTFTRATLPLQHRTKETPMRVITTRDKAALLKLAQAHLHPRATLGQNDEFMVHTPSTHPHMTAYDWRCGYLAADGADAILVDTQGDVDEIACYVPENVVAVTFVYGGKN